MIRVYSDKLRARIRAEMNDTADAVATGSAADFSEYKCMVGKIEGLAVAERMLLDLFAEYSSGDTLDDAD